LKKRILNNAKRHSWLKALTIPGFQGVPLYYVVRRLLHEIQSDNIATRASSISFFFILAIFPGIIFLFSIFPYIPIRNFQANAMFFLESVIPPNVYQILHQTIQDIVSAERSGSLVSINFIIASVMASNGVNSMLRAFDKSNHTFKKRTFWQKNITSFKILILIASQLIISVVLVIKGKEFVSLLLHLLDTDDNLIRYAIKTVKAIIVLFTTFNLYALIYYFGPATKEKYTYFSVGATFATIVSLIFSYIFTFYTLYLHNFNRLYGSLGIIIVVMMWININAFVLLFGFELNHSVLVNKLERKESSSG
jgi:membrane protein